MMAFNTFNASDAVLVQRVFLDGDLDDMERFRFHVVCVGTAMAHPRGLGRAALSLLKSCDGRCIDRCSFRRLAIIERLEDLLAQGVVEGWAVRGKGRTVALPPGVRVTRVISVTGVAGGIGVEYEKDFGSSSSEMDEVTDALVVETAALGIQQ